MSPLLLALAAPLVVHQAAAQEPVQAGSVAGLVFDGATGLPLPDATVVVGAVNTRTDEFGAFFVSVDAGTASVRIRGPQGGAADIGELPVVRGEVTEVLATVFSDGRPAVVSIEAAIAPSDEELEEDAQLTTVTGVVVDEKGKPIEDARIYVRGWTEEARTGKDGTWSMQVPVGSRDFSILRSGYSARSLEAVPISADGTPPIQVEMIEAGLALAEFRITVPRISGGDAALQAERQDASEVVDSLSAEQMSKRGDSSAASALRRVTGLTVVGGKYVYVRGLGERYSSSLFNGSTLPSPEPGRRVVPLDLFPTAMLESVVIQKTYSASMPGEFGGGVVRLRTRGVPEEPIFKVSLSGSYQDGTTWQDGYGMNPGPTDWLTFGAGSRQLPPVFANQIKDTPLQVKSSLPGSEGFEEAQFEEIGRLIPNTWGLTPLTTTPDYSTSVVAGAGIPLGDTIRIGGIAGGTYRNGWQLLDINTTVYNIGGENGELTPFDTFRFFETTNTVALSGIAHVGVEVGEDHEVTGTFTYTRDADSIALQGYGEEGDIGGPTRREREQWVERQLWVQQIAGGHTLPKWLLRTEIDWRYAYSQASRDEPNRRDILMQPTNVDDLYTSGWQMRVQGGGNDIVYSDLFDEVGDGGLDIKVPWGNPDKEVQAWRGSLQVGLQRVERVRSVGVRRFRYDYRGTDSSILVGDPSEIFVPENIATDGLRPAEGTLANDNYRAEQSIAGNYVQGQVTAKWGTGLLVGARLEESRQVAETFDRFADEDAEAIRAVVQNRDLLPAFTLTQPLTRFEADRLMQLRFGFGRTVNRPDLRELSPSIYFDPRTGQRIVGNPELKRAIIDNFDLRWEWYLSPDESVSVAGFTKTFLNPIEFVVEPGAAALIAPKNADSAFNNGVEFDFRKNLWFGAGESWLEGVYLAANAAFINSEINIGNASGILTSAERPLAGQSPWVINGVLSWEGIDSPFGAALLYNVAGPRITRVGTTGIPDQIAEPVHRLDAVASWDIGAGFGAKVSGRNLLDSPRRETVGDEVALEYREGWQIGLGVSWKAEAKDN